jgi:hypothetical protein
VSTLVLDRVAGAPGAGGSEAGRPGAFLAGPRGGPTLDELITSVWEGLSANETVSCPACGGAMGPRYAAGARAVAGSCHDCHTQLS